MVLENADKGKTDEESPRQLSLLKYRENTT